MWVWEGFYLEDPLELTFANTLLLSNAAISLGNAFINLEISSEYIIFFTLWSFFLSSLFISLQIKEFRILALSINDSLYSSLFFFLTGLHFFHLSIGLILLIYFWCSRSSSITSSGHRLSPPSCDHCWWLKGLEVIRKICEVKWIKEMLIASWLSVMVIQCQSNHKKEEIII